MTERTLSRSQKNEIAILAKAVGLQMADFSWEIVNQGDSVSMAGRRVSRLLHVPTGAWFLFDFGQNTLWSEWMPEHHLANNYNSAPDWPRQHQQVTRWMGMVVKDFTAPDLWALARQERELLTVPDGDDDNRPFTVSERADLTARVTEIHRFLIASAEVTEEAKTRIEAKIDYVIDAGNRLGRKDFYNMIGGVLMGLAVQVGLPPERAQAFMAFASTQLAGVLGYLRSIGP